MSATWRTSSSPYSRTDGDFVRELHDFLTAAARTSGSTGRTSRRPREWEQDIDDSIDAAESFVFVVSAAARSPPSTARRSSARGRGRQADRADRVRRRRTRRWRPQALRQLNWIWCRQSDDRAGGVRGAARALDTDLAWARAHTRLLVRAVEWERAAGRQPAAARQGSRGGASRSSPRTRAKEPRPTELQQRTCIASRRGAARRQRSLLGGVTLALVVSVALGVVALLQRNTANDRARVARSQAFAAAGVEAVSLRPATALADAVKAIETSATPEAGPRCGGRSSPTRSST